MESSQSEYTKLKIKGLQNWPNMMIDNHHGIHANNSHDLSRSSSSTRVNVNEDPKQLLIYHKTSHLKMSLKNFLNTICTFTNLASESHSRILSIHNQLYQAAIMGNWKTAEMIEDNNKGFISNVISEDRKETALHIATRFKRVEFVEKLVEKLTKEDLEAKNIYGNTALCIAATSGVVPIAECMVRKHNDLVLTCGAGNATPILVAARYKHSSMVDYLLKAMNFQQMGLDEQMELLFSAISADQYDIALLILNWNKSLTLKRDSNEETPLHVMARKSNIISTKNKLTKWQSFINNNCLKHICKKKEMQIKARETVELMWSEIHEKKNEDEIKDFILHPSSMLHDAASIGNVEFVRILLFKNPDLLRILDGSGKSIFHIAVENRQRGVFNLIYDMKLFHKDDLLYYFNNKQNISLLELAAKRAHPTHLDRISGAVFQMHHELLWYKEVEDIVKITMKINSNDQKNSRATFTEEHKTLVKEAEKWMKSTANSCMLVATLIATVAFAAAFTVPGGNNENTGFPLFLSHDWFIVFVISDAIALVSSSTAILLFLSILTSRCIENDFLFWLPMELVLGLGSLFLSVLGMVLAFSACCILHYGKDKDWIPLAVISMAIAPLYWFGVLLWKLWADGLAALHATGMSYLFKDRKIKVSEIID